MNSRIVGGEVFNDKIKSNNQASELLHFFGENQSS